MKGPIEFQHPVMGVRLNFECETRSLADLVLKSYPAAGPVYHVSDIVIRIGNSRGPSSPPRRPASFRLEADRLHGRSGGSYFVSDRSNMTASAELCSEMLLNEYLLRHQILNTMIYFLLSYFWYTPLHAACIQIRETACLFIGKSGCGKSTLAFNAVQRGAPLIAEDLCFLGSSGGRLIVHGDCREIHVGGPRGQAGKHTTHNGKQKTIIPVTESLQRYTAEDPVVFLIRPDHSRTDSCFLQESDHSWVKSLLNPDEPGFDLYSRNRSRHIDLLLKNTAISAYVGKDPDRFFEGLDSLIS